MNNSTHYFEDVFATAAAAQVHLLLPPIIEMKCYGCRIQSVEDFDHAVCQLQQKIFVRICFHDVLNMLNKDHTELHFRTYVYPKREFIYKESWYENLWVNPDWLQLVQDKVVELRSRLMDL